MKKRETLKCNDVANYFLFLVARDPGDLITQLKLQKLLYFAQGISLAIHDEPLFDEEIEAWEHGPVVRELRKVYGAFGRDSLPSPGEMDFDVYTQQQKELIYKIYAQYGEHSAFYLRNLTHEHSIWSDAYKNPDQMISKKSIKEFFKKLIQEGKIQDYSLLISAKDKDDIIDAEDKWWMNYDSGVPSEDLSKSIF
jgi:uncharacterized phage-associated protein